MYLNRLFSVFCILFALLSMANAQEINAVKQRFRSYQDKHRELQNMMEAKELIVELNTLNQLIGFADLAQQNEEDDRFIRLVNQIEVQIRFIDVSLDNVKAQELLKQKTKEAEGLEKKAKQTREEVAQLEESLSINTVPKQPIRLKQSNTNPTENQVQE